MADTTSATTAARGTAQHFRDARSERIAELLTCRHILAVAIEAPLLADPKIGAQHG
ncbi:hypothetical protein [Bradyrhizobium diazoefficiens]|uniref:hypothetical protein n=1 Tax=Bradyrhizobium diazoefficiens TaxID=1355477 RepID=UPI0016011187|nr:hypothetical protein [Bradyrhizobium diazoefficiens]